MSTPTLRIAVFDDDDSEPDSEVAADASTCGLSLLERLDAEQDDVLARLDELNHRLEQLLSLDAAGRSATLPAAECA